MAKAARPFDGSPTLIRVPVATSRPLVRSPQALAGRHRRALGAGEAAAAERIVPHRRRRQRARVWQRRRCHRTCQHLRLFRRRPMQRRSRPDGPDPPDRRPPPDSTRRRSTSAVARAAGAQGRPRRRSKRAASGRRPMPPALPLCGALSASALPSSSPPPPPVPPVLRPPRVPPPPRPPSKPPAALLHLARPRPPRRAVGPGAGRAPRPGRTLRETLQPTSA